MPSTDAGQPFWGYVIGAAALGGVLLFNQFIFRRRWTSYPTEEQYRSDHPESRMGRRTVCHKCKKQPARMAVAGRGYLYRCTGCEDERYRADA